MHLNIFIDFRILLCTFSKLLKTRCEFTARLYQSLLSFGVSILLTLWTEHSVHNVSVEEKVDLDSEDEEFFGEQIQIQ